MHKLQRFRQGSMSVEEYRQQMELLLLRAGHREEERTSIDRFLSGLNMEVRDKVELLPYWDLDDLVQLCIRVEHKLKRKPTSKSYGSHSYPKKDQGQGILGVAPFKPKDDKRDEEEKLEKQKQKKDSKALSSKVKGKEKEDKDSSKKVVKKKNHFATKGDIQRVLLLKQSFYLLL